MDLPFSVSGKSPSCTQQDADFFAVVELRKGKVKPHHVVGRGASTTPPFGRLLSNGIRSALAFLAI